MRSPIATPRPGRSIAPSEGYHNPAAYNRPSRLTEKFFDYVPKGTKKAEE
jgi:hypothetical protein